MRVVPRSCLRGSAPPAPAPYATAEADFAEAKACLSSVEARQMSESNLERELQRRGQALMRKLLQGRLEQRSPGEAAGPVEGADGVERPERRVHERRLETTFGTVEVERVGYARPGHASLHPLDAAHVKHWVVLVDGAETQLDLVEAGIALAIFIAMRLAEPLSAHRRKKSRTLLAHAWFAGTPLPWGGPNVILGASAVLLALSPAFCDLLAGKRFVFVRNLGPLAISLLLVHSTRLAMQHQDTDALFLIAVVAGSLAAYLINSVFHPSGPFVDWHHFFLIGLLFGIQRIFHEKSEPAPPTDLSTGAAE